jgi:hypothetical protein
LLHRERMASLLCIGHKGNSRSWIQIGVLVELDIVITTAPIEKLHVDLASRQGGTSQPDDCENTLDYLSPDDGILVQSGT